MVDCDAGRADAVSRIQCRLVALTCSLPRPAFTVSRCMMFRRRAARVCEGVPRLLAWLVSRLLRGFSAFAARRQGGGGGDEGALGGGVVLSLRLGSDRHGDTVNHRTRLGSRSWSGTMTREVKEEALL